MSHRSSSLALLALAGGLLLPSAGAQALEFNQLSDFWMPGGARDLVVTDFGPDGRLEVVTPLETTRQMSVMIHDAGRIGGANFTTFGSAATAIDAADVNGDGNPEVATANRDEASFTILAGNRLGGLSWYSTQPLPGTTPVAVAIADLDGADNADLAIVDGGSPGSVRIMRGGTALNSWSAGPSVAVGAFPSAIAVGDFDGDDDVDLATANTGDDTVSVALGDGSGGFGAATSSFVGSQPAELLARDLDGDGALDLAVLNRAGNNVAVLLGAGDGSFAAPVAHPVGPLPEGLAAADFDGDGVTDLATIRGGVAVTILRGDGDGGFAPFAGSPFAIAGHPTSIGAGDFDGDDLADLVTVDGPGEVIAIRLNTTRRAASTVAPSITGTLLPGSTVTRDRGVWSGTELAYRYAWSRDGVALAGEEGPALAVTEADRDRELRCAVTASNELGATTAESRPLGVPLPPTVATGAATALAPTSATLNGLLTPGLAATTYRFEYGPTTAYGSTTPEQTVGAGREAATRSALLEGLEPGREYHARLVASNLAGTTAGGDVVFTTPSLPPAPRSTPPTGTPDPTATAAPRVTAAPAAIAASRDVEIAFALPDGAGADCRLDGGPWTPCASPLQLKGLTAGDHVVLIRTRGAGDAAAVAVRFQVNPYAPRVTVARPAGGLTLRGAKARLTLTCSPLEGARSGVCAGTATVRPRAVKAGAGPLARGSFRLRAGERASVPLRLTSRGRRALRAARGALPVRVVIAARDLAGNRSTVSLAARMR